MGVNDICYLFSCINVKPPALSGFHKKVNLVVDQMIQLNTESMTANQEYLKHVKEMAGETAEVNVETDASYNNRPQSGFEAATQSFCPMVEQDTRQKLVLSMATANKLCVKKNCNHNNNNCRQNFSTAETISSSESKLVRKNLENINEKGILTVKSVTCDASAQIEKCIRDYSSEKKAKIQHYKCFIHKLRTLQKHLRNVRITSKLTGCDKEIYSLRLAIAIRARVRLELVRMKRHFSSSTEFIKRSQAAIENILPCFPEKHIK